MHMQQQFTWDPQHEALVRREWQEKTHVRLKDMMHKAANTPPHVIITWMTDDVRAALKYIRETDEGFRTRSERNRKNKAKIGRNQGSISATVWATKLLNRRPSTAELFITTYQRWTGTDSEFGAMLMHRAYKTNIATESRY